MLPRHLQARLEWLLGKFPAVALLGPRQVGKTCLAQTVAQQFRRPAVYLDLENTADRARLDVPDAFFQEHMTSLVVLNEVQCVPDLFTQLRGIIDRRRRAGDRSGHFLLLGSASPALLRQSAESLAGRLVYAELSPFCLSEVGVDGALTAAHEHTLWRRGGFPDSYLAADDASSQAWREAFIVTYLARDIPRLGPHIPATTLRRLWTMLAHEQGNMLNVARLAAGLTLSGQTVARYIDLLVDLLLVRRLLPWERNLEKRLVRAPKIYLRDSGLAHALLKLHTHDDLLSHPVVGGSWEGFVLENILSVAPPNTTAGFYRSKAGAEIDLILELPHNKVWAIEIKRSANPHLGKGFFSACATLQPDARLIVHGGTYNGMGAQGVLTLTLAVAMQAVAQADLQAIAAVTT